MSDKFVETYLRQKYNVKTVQGIGSCILGGVVPGAGGLCIVYGERKGNYPLQHDLWLSKEERACADKSAAYRLATAVFGCPAGAFACLSLYAFTLWVWARAARLALLLFVLIDAIADTVRNERKKWVTEPLGICVPAYWAYSSGGAYEMLQGFCCFLRP